MAVVPTSGTNIRLLPEIPFHADYKHTRWFDTIEDQTAYFLNKSPTHLMSEANFQRIEGRHIVKVNRPIDDLWRVNYMLFQNAQYSGKWFYAFVTKLEYINKNLTHVHFKLDVLQTWRFEMRFKPSFIVREHCELWNSDGSPVINTVDEGLHYGSDYETVSIKNFVPFDDVFFMVIVSKQTMHGGTSDTSEIKPTVNGAPQPLSYYVHPFRLSGGSPKVRVSGTAIDLGMSTISDVMLSMYKQEDAVNNIVSIYVTEHIGSGVTYDGTTMTFSETNFEHVTIQDAENTINTLYVEKLPTYESTTRSVGNKYDDYQPVKESKLLMYPYTVLLLDDFKGNRIEIKNEYIDDFNIDITTRGSLGVSNKVSYGLTKYLTQHVDTVANKKLISLEKSVINNNPNDIPIITDLLSAYLQGNKNTINNQANTMMFNGIMGGVGNSVNAIGALASGNPMGALQSTMGIVQGTGSAVLQMQGLQAKQDDISNVPPSISKMGANTAFDYGNGYQGIFIIKKQITAEYRKKLSDFFNMFGYKVNEVKVPNFHTRRYWNYVQTSNCTITGWIVNEDILELQQVFDNGITLWHADEIGRYNLNNEVI